MSGDEVAVVSLNLQSVALDRTTGPGRFLDLLEESLKGGFFHSGLENHHHVFAAPLLPPDFDLARFDGDLSRCLLAATREVFALGAPIGIGGEGEFHSER